MREEIYWLDWQVPAVKPAMVIETYLIALRSENVHPIGIWAKVDGATLRIYTLVPEDESEELAVYRAQMQTLGKWPEVDIDFRDFRARDLDKWETTYLRDATVVNWLY
jgi:hypothetical protein